MSMTSPPTILARSARVPLFLMLRYLADQSAGRDVLDRHLDWMVTQERAGKVFLSGPVDSASQTVGDLVGATVLRAADRPEALRIAETDPFVAVGYVDFKLHDWTAYEGAIPFTVRLSDSSVVIG